jgi:hypothetical protein
MMDKEAHNRPHGGASEDDLLGPELPQLLRKAEPPPGDLDALYAQLTGSVAAERGLRAWLRARSTGTRALLATSVMALLAVLSATVFQRPDLGVYPGARMAGVLLVIGAGVTLLLALALRPLQRPAPPAWALALATAGALLALLAAYAMPAAHLAHPASLQAPGLLPLLQRALPCLVIGVVLGGVVYAALVSLDRGGSRRALATAAASGLAANLVLHLHCPVTEPMHMVLGHLGVAVFLIAAAVSFERRVSR